MKRARFKVYRSNDGWRWRLIAANGKIVCTGEAHSTKGKAERAMLAMPAIATAAKIRNIEESAS